MTDKEAGEPGRQIGGHMRGVLAVLLGAVTAVMERAEHHYVRRVATSLSSPGSTADDARSHANQPFTQLRSFMDSLMASPALQSRAGLAEPASPTHLALEMLGGVAPELCMTSSLQEVRHPLLPAARRPPPNIEPCFSAPTGPQRMASVRSSSQGCGRAAAAAPCLSVGAPCSRRDGGGRVCAGSCRGAGRRCRSSGE